MKLMVLSCLMLFSLMLVNANGMIFQNKIGVIASGVPGGVGGIDGIWYGEVAAYYYELAIDPPTWVNPEGNYSPVAPGLVGSMLAGPWEDLNYPAAFNTGKLHLVDPHNYQIDETIDEGLIDEWVWCGAMWFNAQLNWAEFYVQDLIKPDGTGGGIGIIGYLGWAGNGKVQLGVKYWTGAAWAFQTIEIDAVPIGYRYLFRVHVDYQGNNIRLDVARPDGAGGWTELVNSDTARSNIARFNSLYLAGYNVQNGIEIMANIIGRPDAMPSYAAWKARWVV